MQLPTKIVKSFVAVSLLTNIHNTFAEESDDIEVITVTSDKTSSTQMNTAKHLTVLDSSYIESENINSVKDLESRVTGFSFQPLSLSGVNMPVLRGLTSGFMGYSSSVLLLVNDVPTIAAQGFEASFTDISRIEVQRGPQSAAYGRNAEVGVISMYSQDLQGDDVYQIKTEAGSRNLKAASINLDHTLLEDRLYVSASASTSEQEGFIENISDGSTEDDRKNINFTSGLRWLISDNTDVTLRYRQQEYDDGGTLWGLSSSDEREVSSNTDSWTRSLSQNMSLALEHELASGMHLSTVTAYNRYDDKFQQDTDLTEADLSYVIRDNKLRHLSQDIRLQGQVNNAEWLIGVYAENQDNALHNTIESSYPSDISAQLDINAVSLYNNWRVPLSNNFTLKAGARLAHESVELTPENENKHNETWTNFSPQVSLQYKINQQHMSYVTLAQGIRSGGFNSLVSAVDYLAYDPETANSLEIGLKGQSPVNKFHYSLAAYFMKIDDMQVSQVPSLGIVYITNAANAESYGLELSTDYRFDQNWLLSFNMAWNKTNFNEFIDGDNDYSGNSNPFSPAYNGSLMFSYQADSGWFVNTSILANGKLYLDSANEYKQAAYQLLNLSMGFPIFNNGKLTFNVENLTDKEYDVEGYRNGFLNVYSQPREASMRVAWSF